MPYPFPAVLLFVNVRETKPRENEKIPFTMEKFSLCGLDVLRLGCKLLLPLIVTQSPLETIYSNELANLLAFRAFTPCVPSNVTRLTYSPSLQALFTRLISTPDLHAFFLRGVVLET